MLSSAILTNGLTHSKIKFDVNVRWTNMRVSQALRNKDFFGFLFVVFFGRGLGGLFGGVFVLVDFFLVFFVLVGFFFHIASS